MIVQYTNVYFKLWIAVCLPSVCLQVCGRWLKLQEGTNWHLWCPNLISYKSNPIPLVFGQVWIRLKPQKKSKEQSLLQESIWTDQRFWIHRNWSKKKAKRRPFETKLLSKWKAVLNSIEVVEENKWKPFARNRMKHHLQRSQSQPLLLWSRSALLWIRSEALMDLQKTYT